MRYTRRYNVVLAVGFGCTAVLASVVGAWTGGGVWYALKAAAFFAIVTVAVTTVAGAEHPYPRFGAANVVTTTRAMLAALAAGLIGYPAPAHMLWGVIGLTGLVAVLDGLDGWLARATRMISAFGARFDMETDAAFILVLSVLVWQHGKAGVWVLLCGLMRYGFVAAGWLVPWLGAPLRATLRARMVAVGQFVGLSIALSPSVPVPASAAVAAATLAVLMWSFAVDVAFLARNYRE